MSFLLETNDGADKKFPRMEGGKSLSKNLLYAPLEAYHKAACFQAVGGDSDYSTSDSNFHPSQYMSLKSSIPKSLQESSLVSLFHSISCNYHRNRAMANDAKNNGSRPLGLSDIEERIRQRAVTLVSGGINSSIKISNDTVKSKKRRRRRWDEMARRPRRIKRQ